jgi:DNA-binding CsgD family transcriptional regulator
MTPREAEICDALMTGRSISNAAIARQLGISIHTLRGHLYRLFLIFRVQSRLQLVMELHRLGY